MLNFLMHCTGYRLIDDYFHYILFLAFNKLTSIVNTMFNHGNRRKNFASIVVYVLVEYCISPKISRCAHIYGMLTRTPKIRKKIKINNNNKNKKPMVTQRFGQQYHQLQIIRLFYSTQMAWKQNLGDITVCSILRPYGLRRKTVRQ